MAAVDRDRQAWLAICGWPAETGFDPVREGLDYALLTRWFLWDKVGHTIRRQRDPGEVEFEDAAGPAAAEAVAERVAISESIRRTALQARLAARRTLGQRRSLYAPFPYSRHARILETLLREGASFDVVVPAAHAAAWPGAIPWRFAQPDSNSSMAADEQMFANQLADAMLVGLSAQGIELMDADRTLLRRQAGEQVGHVRQAATVLARLRPDALLVPADNHPPFIDYVLTARKAGIPVVMLQHGLDCERHYLDDSYATHIAVWGAQRAERYRRDSAWQPERIDVVGNPYYDDWAALPAGDPFVWLWVTRPHRPSKCYPPSRRPDEGLQIFDALIEALAGEPRAQLVIKPHNFDYAARYAQHIPAALAGRVSIAEDTVVNLLQRAGVVIAEDSTAGMDAMMGGRVVVHAHFAESKPVMPFVDYGAALPGFNVGQLQESLRGAVALNATEAAEMRAGQQRFLDDFAGPRDGHASRRFAAFVESVLNR